jgi:hypothetical protein
VIIDKAAEPTGYVTLALVLPTWAASLKVLLLPMA